MTEARDTKRMFADELEAMMADMPLSKVRVRDLCARCGVERCTFYYHFKDKYDLVAWMLDQETIRAAWETRPYTREHFALGLALIWERRDFYRRCFAEGSQNSIYRHHLQYCVEENGAIVRHHLGAPELTREAAMQVRFFALGNAGSVASWLLGELDATPGQLADGLFECMPPLVREAYEALLGAEG